MDNDDPKSNSTNQSSLQRFWQELKRRKVMRVAITYAVVAWLIIQIASVTFEGFGIPIWAFRFVMLMIILGFPLAIILTWAFELTPDGIKTTKVARDEASESPESAKIQSKRTWMKLGLAAAAPTVIFGALAAFFYLQSRTSDSELSTSIEKSIAVLPLQNLSPDPENAFFADGVQEDILTNLSKIEELLVISRSSTLRYREREKSLKEIGAELEVRYLVEGSVRRAGKRVLVTAQLIDVETDAHLWAENFNRPLDDIFAIQAEIAKTIAAQLHAVISPEAIDRIEYRPTESQEAYDYWVKYFATLLDIDRGRREEKIELLENALAHDPKFAEAWAKLAVERFFKWAVEKKRKDPELLAQAYRDFDKAKELKPDMADIPYVEGTIAQVVERDYQSMIDALLRTLAIDPSYSDATRRLGIAYRGLGRLAEAQHSYEAALRVDPLSPHVNKSLFGLYSDRRMWGEARALLDENLERDANPVWQYELAELNFLQYGDRQVYLDDLKALPDFDSDSSLKIRHALFSRDLSTAQELLKSGGFGPGILNRNLTRTLLRFASGREDFARAIASNWEERIKKELRENNDQSQGDTSALPIYLAVAGKRDEMEATVSMTREHISKDFFKFREALKSEIRIAIAYIVLGDHEKAIETLEAASKLEGPYILARELDLWFIFDHLRGNPRFDKLLED